MFDEFLQTAIEAAQAGAAVLDEWSGKFTVSEKSRANLVTEADFASQRTIHDVIIARFPEHGFLGEEDAEIVRGPWSVVRGEEPPGVRSQRSEVGGQASEAVALDSRLSTLNSRPLTTHHSPTHSSSVSREATQRTTDHGPRTKPSYRWIVDPLDGTSNYVHRFPYYAVSIGLEADGEPVVGVILDPNRDELFSAVKGQGAFLNGKPILPSETERLNEALVVASLPVHVAADHISVRQFLAVLTTAQHLQRTGSAALNLCYVACGRLEAFFSGSLKPWDVAAGRLIVAEAGGRVTKMDGGPFDLFRPDLLASNGRGLHEELSGVLTAVE